MAPATYCRVTGGSGPGFGLFFAGPNGVGMRVLQAAAIKRAREGICHGPAQWLSLAERHVNEAVVI